MKNKNKNKNINMKKLAVLSIIAGLFLVFNNALAQYLEDIDYGDSGGGGGDSGWGDWGGGGESQDGNWSDWSWTNDSEVPVNDYTGDEWTTNGGDWGGDSSSWGNWGSDTYVTDDINYYVDQTTDTPTYGLPNGDDYNPFTQETEPGTYDNSNYYNGYIEEIETDEYWKSLPGPEVYNDLTNGSNSQPGTPGSGGGSNPGTTGDVPGSSTGGTPEDNWAENFYPDANNTNGGSATVPGSGGGSFMDSVGNFFGGIGSGISSGLSWLGNSVGSVLGLSPSGTTAPKTAIAINPQTGQQTVVSIPSNYTTPGSSSGGIGSWLGNTIGGLLGISSPGSSSGKTLLNNNGLTVAHPDSGITSQPQSVGWPPPGTNPSGGLTIAPANPSIAPQPKDVGWPPYGTNPSGGMAPVQPVIGTPPSGYNEYINSLNGAAPQGNYVVDPSTGATYFIPSAGTQGTGNNIYSNPAIGVPATGYNGSYMPNGTVPGGINPLTGQPTTASGGWNISAISGFGLPNQSIMGIIRNVLMWLLTALGIIGIIGFIISGIMYLTAAGNEDQIKKAKAAMTASIYGVIVGLAGVVIIQAVEMALRGMVF